MEEKEKVTQKEIKDFLEYANKICDGMDSGILITNKGCNLLGNGAQLLSLLVLQMQNMISVGISVDDIFKAARYASLSDEELIKTLEREVNESE